MHVILVLLVSSLVVVSQQQTLQEALKEWRKVVAPHMSRCMCQSNTSPETIEALFEYAELPTDPCFKCNMRCWEQGVGLFSTSGNVNTTVFRSFFGITDEIVHTCGSNKNVDMCQKIFEIVMCTFNMVQARATSHPLPTVPQIKLWNSGPKIFYERQ